MYFSDDEDDDLAPFFGFGPRRRENPLAFLMAQQLFAQQRLAGLRREESRTNCNVFIKGWSTKLSSERQKFSSPTQSLFSAKLATMFNEPGNGLADMYIGAVGGPKVRAHQVVVASWSENMKTFIIEERLKWSLLLQSKYARRECDRFLVVELKMDKECAEVFLDFIRFMYTESVSLNLKTVWPLIRLASQYQVNELLETCIKFIFQRVTEIPISHSLEEVMMKAIKLGVSKAIVQTTMQRILRELFLNEATSVSSLSVDLLCDVLRSSDVVALSEFDIFQKLKPKLEALREEGEHRQVLRLLSLLRLTQMTSSELREFSSSEYMDEVRRAFPGRLETALWTRAIYSEQDWEDVPMNIERQRLYLKCQVPFAYEIHGYDYNDYLGRETMTRVKKLDAQPEKLENPPVVVVREGKQLPKEDFAWRYGGEHQFSVYKVSIGKHGITRLPEKWTLSVPTGEFPVLTVDIVKPRGDEHNMWKVVLVFNKTTLEQTSSVVTVSVFECHQSNAIKVRCPIETLRTSSENFEVTIQVVGYAYDVGRAHFSHLVLESCSSEFPSEREEYL